MRSEESKKEEGRRINRPAKKTERGRRLKTVPLRGRKLKRENGRRRLDDEHGSASRTRTKYHAELHRKYKEAKADLEENDDEKEGELFDALQKKYVELLMEKVKENSQAAAATKAATATATATAAG